MLVVNESPSNHTPSVTLYRATDLTLIGTSPLPSSSNPFGVCSDGVNFWIALSSLGKLGRF